MICLNQSNRGPLEKKEKEKKLKSGSLPPPDPSGPVEKRKKERIPTCRSKDYFVSAGQKEDSLKFEKDVKMKTISKIAQSNTCSRCI